MQDAIITTKAYINERQHVQNNHTYVLNRSCIHLCVCHVCHQALFNSLNIMLQMRSLLREKQGQAH